MKLILIRHGETEWTPEKRFLGKTDLPLSPNGIRQIKKIAVSIQKAKPGVIYSSALMRAKQSAEIIAGNFKKNVLIDPRLNEMGFGKWEGRTSEDLILTKDKIFLRWQKGLLAAPPGGESLQAVRKRVRQALADLKKKHPDETVVLVAHGGTIRILLIEALQLPYSTFWKFQVSPASVTKLIVNGSFAQLDSLNKC